MGPLGARRRGDQLRAIAIDLIATADNLYAAEARVSELEAECTRLRREMATAMATRPSTGGNAAAVPPPEPEQGETPAPDAGVLQARPTRRKGEGCDEFAARCYLHGYRTGHAAGQRFAAWQADNPPDEAGAVPLPPEVWQVQHATPAGVLRATFEPFATTTEPDA